MTKIVYLDRNVFDCLKKQFIVSDSEFRLIRDGIRSGKIVIPASLVVIEETLPVLRNGSKFKIETERFLLQELLDWQHWIKLHWELVDDDIKSFAKAETLPDRFRATPMLDANDFFGPHQRRIVEERIAEIKTQKTHIKDRMQEAKTSVLKNGAFSKTHTFEKLWEEVSLAYVEILAQRLGLIEECRERGLGKLLEIRSVKFNIAWHVSYLYQTVIKGERITPSDPYDHQHVVCASVADIFVTQDTRLTKIMNYVPLERFEIMNLQAFLNRLKCWESFSLLARCNRSFEDSQLY
jgi:hypothetical protein